jgi:hypothetical protein
MLMVASSCSYPTRIFGAPDDAGGAETDGASNESADGADGADGAGSAAFDAAADSSLATDAADASAKKDAAVSPPPDASIQDAALDGPPCSALSSGIQNFPATPQIFGCLDTKRPDAATGGTTWAERATLCGAGCQPCTAQRWADYRRVPAGGGAPVDAGLDAAPLPPDPLRVASANFWVDDDLVFVSGTSTDCVVAVSGEADSGICVSHHMHICVESVGSGPVSDVTGDSCQVHDCGYGIAVPDLDFGGCGPDYAGTLCCCDR